LHNSSNTTARSPDRLFSSRLAREITVVLVVKSIALYVIWLAFFSEPVSPRLTADRVSEAIVGGGTGRPAVPQHNNE
jgi:hypothetical protein